MGRPPEAASQTALSRLWQGFFTGFSCPSFGLRSPGLALRIEAVNSQTVDALRQRSQLLLAVVVAGTLVVVSLVGAWLAQQADERAGLAARRVATTLVGEATARKRAEFLAIVRDQVDGLLVVDRAGVSLPPSALVSGRQSGISLMLADRSGKIIEAETGLRLGGAGETGPGRQLAELALRRGQGLDLAEGGEKLVVTADIAGLVFAEPLRRTAPSHAAAGPSGVSIVAAWPLESEALSAQFSEFGLSALQFSASPPEAGERSGVLYRPEASGAGLYISWVNPMTATLQWVQLLPLVSLALVGVLLTILRGVRFQREATGIVADIERAAFDRATRDPLTGLRNRSGFKMRLDEAVAERGEEDLVGVVYIDLDRFKEVNDGYGHEMGDKLLVAVTERLTAICGRDVTIARLGGDEFAVVVTKRRMAGDIVAMGVSISRELGTPFTLGTTEVVIGGSVGIAISPEDGIDATELVRRADISMYRAKTGGRGQAIRFHASMEDEIKRRKFLEGELRHAIARHQLQVFYQPYLSSDGDSLVGVEALMRWTHPTEGDISPGVFVPLAEETGLIVEIGDWMMRRAMTDALSWPDVHIALNVSPVQFRRKELVENTVALVTEIGIARERVEIEITEGVLMEDAEAAIEVIQGFRDAGLHVALDDFGTGYASLSYLRKFPFDKLKVDQAFVRNLGVTAGSAAIIHSVVALGRSLGMTVHAEGIETMEHHIFLRAAGCHHFQGYYFAKAMPKEEMDVYVARKKGPIPRLAMRA
jgi:diguanylate cyclase (GGDEF)-like protein